MDYMGHGSNPLQLFVCVNNRNEIKQNDTNYTLVSVESRVLSCGRFELSFPIPIGEHLPETPGQHRLGKLARKDRVPFCPLLSVFGDVENCLCRWVISFSQHQLQRESRHIQQDFY